jgi:hypothetical protein
MIGAEALEISQINADQYLDSNDPKVKPLFQSNTAGQWG